MNDRFSNSNLKPSGLFRASYFVLRVSAAAVLASSTASAIAAAEVRLRSSVGCAAAVVRLADVAEVFAEDARLVQSLGEIPLCPAPHAGNQRTISQEEVRELMALSGVERTLARITGSQTVTVTAEAVGSASSPMKRPLVATGVRQASFETESLPATKPVESRATSKTSTTAAPEAKQGATPPLVDRGATLTVVARTAGVRITTSGKALEAGAMGDTIGVELADTKQRVLANVTGPQTAEVASGASRN